MRCTRVGRSWNRNRGEGFVLDDPSKPEEMNQYERLVALIEPRQISVANLGGLKASGSSTSSDRLGKKFTLHSHLIIRITSILPAWGESLVGKLSDAATHDLVLKGPPAGA